MLSFSCLLRKLQSATIEDLNTHKTFAYPLKRPIVSIKILPDDLQFFSFDFIRSIFFIFMKMLLDQIGLHTTYLTKKRGMREEKDLNVLSIF